MSVAAPQREQRQVWRQHRLPAGRHMQLQKLDHGRSLQSPSLVQGSRPPLAACDWSVHTGWRGGHRLLRELGHGTYLFWILLQLAFTWGVGVSRFNDNKHHPSDVRPHALAELPSLHRALRLQCQRSSAVCGHRLGP